MIKVKKKFSTAYFENLIYVFVENVACIQESLKNWNEKI
jgi:hypothetical protein